VKDIDTLEAQFKAELLQALRRAAKGRSPTLFSLEENRERSSARRLRKKAERIIELRKSYSVDPNDECPAASYLAACLKWEHGKAQDQGLCTKVAEGLLRELTQAALLVLVFLHAGAALGQTAERPGVSVGDRWQFVVWYTQPSTQPNRAWVITAVGPDGIEGTENGEPLRLTPELNVLDSPLRQESNPGFLRFPLEVGKTWRYASDWVFKPKGSRGTLLTDVAVLAHEKVSVPAGTFEAFRLVAKGSLGGNSPGGSFYAGDIVTTYWYAPAARAIVKSVAHNPYLGPSTVELVSLELRRE
jgi:hypothetical protein